MREINGALSQMRLSGAAGGGALRFPLQWSGEEAIAAVTELRHSWADYAAQVHQEHLFTEPAVLVERLFWLDVAFIISYTLLCAFVLMMAARFRPLRAGFTAYLGVARRRMLSVPLLCIVPLAVVDMAENLALRAAYLDGSRLAVAIGPVPVGPLLSVLKLLLVALVLLPMLVAGLGTVFDSVPLRQAVTASRVVVLLVVVTVLLLATGIGAGQVDDVIRAWDRWYALFATLAVIVAALVVVGTIIDLTADFAGHLSPDHGGDPQPILIKTGLALAALGAVCWMAGLGWGLLVPATMALLLALLSAPLTRSMPPAGHDRGVDQSAQVPVAHYGMVLARVTGAVLLAVLIWVLVRAATFPLAVRLGETTLTWMWDVADVAVLFAGVGVVVLLRRTPPGRTRLLWGTLAGVASLTSLATLVPAWSVTVPTGLGTVAVLMLGLAGSAGTYTAVVRVVRRRAVSRLRLVPALRVLGLKRFPVIVLGLVWVLLVTMLDRGGFHDIRTLPARQPGPPPTLEQAYRAWLAAGPESALSGSTPQDGIPQGGIPQGTTPRGAAPLVLVAAQGGGIRAAVWTALVLECVFGPGPVRGSADCPGEVDGGSSAVVGGVVRGQSLPVFLASGASGGSLGLAVWSARRADLVAGGAVAARTPSRVTDALSGDFVAPDLARLLFGDLFHLFLAHDLPDRAEVLELSWEQRWPAGRVGLARGLRDTYQQANGPPGRWRIPILALNGTQVEDGCRLVASPVDFEVSRQNRIPGHTPEGDLDHPSDTACGAALDDSDGLLVDALPRTTELVDYLCPDTDVPLSTAALLSARFPFVSPTGRVTRGECPKNTDVAGLLPVQSISYDLDGGLFDNSGSATALAAWRALAPLAAADETAGRECVVPLFLQIDNSPSDEPKAGPDPPPFEPLAPVTAMMGEVGSRQAAASATAATEFGRPRSPAGALVWADGHPIDSQWFRVTLLAQPGPEPPLGWTLAETTVDNMRAQLSIEQNRATIAELHHLLTTPLRCG